MKKEKKRKALSKILLTNVIMTNVVSTLAVTITVVTLFAIRIAANNITVLNYATDYTKLQLESWIGHITSEIDTAGNSLASMEQIGSKGDWINYCRGSLTLDEDIPNGLYIGDGSTNEYWDATWTPDSEYIVSGRDWYTRAIESNSVVVTPAYYDSNTNDMSVSVAKKINNSAVVSADISLETIQKRIDDMEIIGDDNIILLDFSTGQGIIIASNNKDYIGKSTTIVDPFIDEVCLYCRDNSSDDSTVVYKGSDNHQYYLRQTGIAGTSWALIIYTSKSSVFRETGFIKMIVSTYLLVIVLLIVIALVIAKAIKQVTKPISNSIEVINSIASGDFTVSANVTGNSDLATMSETLNNFISVMRDYVLNLQSSYMRLAEISERSNESAGKMNDLTNAQNGSTQVMTEQIGEMTRSINEVATSATELATSANNVTELSEEVLRSIEDTVNNSNEGKDAMDNMTSSIVRISDNVDDLANTIAEVNSAMDEVSTINATIKGIASQTNLLSLNASIEAARAGESGKGFAVVASEIGTLAKTCSDAVESIDKVLTGITTMINEIMDKANTSVNDVKVSREAIEDSMGKFAAIHSSISKSEKIINEMNVTIHGVNDVATNVAAITEEQLANIEEVLVKTQQISKDAENILDESKLIADLSVEISDASNDIKESIDFFTV